MFNMNNIYVRDNLKRSQNMVKDTKKPTKNARSKALEKYLSDAKARLPSERSKSRCKGCFAPRNTLTVKPHIEKIWNTSQIELKDSFVMVNCHFCNEKRRLSLSSFSYDVFKSDMDEYSNFILLKDDKYNAFIGVKAQKGIDLSKFYEAIDNA